MYKKILSIFLFLCFYSSFSQPISLYRQFFGTYDFTMIGNTLSTSHNDFGISCTVLTQSSATLNLNPNQTVAAAYLYWSSTELVVQDSIDLDVTLNGVSITAQRTFTNNVGYVLSAFADVTNLVKTTGNGTYLFADFGTGTADCASSGYGGWAIVIVYEETSLSNRMVNIYDGLELISNNRSVLISLENINLSDTADAKLAFLVWEGDAPITNGDEYLAVNSNKVSNPPLNPINNIYNGTNSFTGSNTLYNMDLDYFDIEDFISVGDTSMDIEMHSHEFIVANVFALTLINQIPDATIVMDNITVTCDSREIEVSYTVSNFNASEALPVNTPIAFYADGVLVGTTTTRSSIAMKGSESGNITLSIPAAVGDDFVLTASADDDGTGNGSVNEADEDNNTDTENVILKFSPEINQPDDVIICNVDRRDFVIFDLASKRLEISTDTNVTISFYQSEEDAERGVNAINNTGNYELESRSSQIIWVRATHPENDCVSITYFTITAQELPFTGLEEPLMLCNLKDNPLVVNLASAHLLLSRMFDYMNEIDLKFYETESDAENEVNEIVNVENYRPVVFPQVVYIRTKGKNNLWCDVIIQLQLNACVIPKGISPNNDGFNDGFDLAVFHPIDLKIFNRYGTVVYEHGEGYTNQWSGQDKNGRMLPTSTYYYVFKTFFDTYVGWVYVIREVR